MTRSIARPQAARFLRSAIPRSWSCRLPVRLGVVVRNVGSTAWRAQADDGRIHYLIAMLDGEVRGHALLPRPSVEPGECVTLNVILQAPGAPGRYSLLIDMVQHDVAYFRTLGSRPILMPVTVDERAPALALAERLRHQAFGLLYRRAPLHALRMAWRAQSAVFHALPRRWRPQVLDRWKRINRQLSYLEQAERVASPLSLPFNLVLDTTGRCNIRCPACFRQALGLDLNHEPDIPAAVLERAIRDLFPTADSANVTVIGEPLLTPYWDRLLSALREYRVGLQLTTNGTILNRKHFTDRLVPVLRHLEVSFDSASPALFERLRAGARFEQVLSNARAIGDIRRACPQPRFHFGLSVTLFSENVGELPGLVRLAAQLGGNRLRATFGVVFREELSHLSILRCPEAYNDVYPKALEAARGCGVQVSLPAPFAINADARATEKGFCRFLYEGARVDRKGRLTACLISNTPLSTEYGRSLRRHWNGEGMRTLRLLHDTPAAHASCRDCYVVNCRVESVEARTRQLFQVGPLTA